MSDDPSDDYFEVVAEVIDAARSLEEASQRELEARNAHLDRYEEKKAAEKVLHEALERLKNTSPRNDKGDTQ